ncbi:MAG: ABC transporter ATP-binding protein [Acidobacteriota bacterium]
MSQEPARIAPETARPRLAVHSLRIEATSERGPTVLVHDVSLHVDPGEAVALVGGSGCGKSLTLLALLGLLPPGLRVTAGSALLAPGDEEADVAPIDLLQADAVTLQRLRGRRLGLVLQEPASALNPVRTLGSQLHEVLARHRGLRGAPARRRGIELLERVAMPEPTRRWHAHPHELSGGQRQRALLALALAGEPDVLLADEPTTALDVTLQAQMLELLDSLRRELGLSLILVTHDLAVVAATCRRAVVLDAGRVVEHGPVESLYAAPEHQATRRLLHAARRGRTHTESEAETDDGAVDVETVDGETVDEETVP